MSSVLVITGIPAPIDANSKLTVTATFEAQKTVSSDWSTGVYVRLYKTQNGSTSYGDSIRMGTTRLPFAIQYTFPLDAGFSIDCGIDWNPSEPTTTSFWDIKILAEVIKR
jgi:hypothetical protein